jgi:hypothetical protein
MRLLNIRARLGASVALLAALTVPAQAADFPCFQDNAMQSARIHDLQVMLMVNALKCRVRHPETLRTYGVLLEQRGQEFGHHGRQIEASMVKEYGLSQGQVAFHRYETTIANFHSLINPSQRQCEEIATYINLAARADHPELESLSRLITGRAIDVCLTPIGTSNVQAVFEPEPLAPPAVLTSAPAAEPAPQIVDGVPTYPVPGTGPDTAAEPLETVAVLASATPPAAVPADPAASTSAEGKLDQAIVALSAAVAALSELRQQP